MSLLKFFSKKVLWWFAGVVSIIIVASAAVVFSGEESNARTVPAMRGNVEIRVSVTGKVKAADAADLAFEKGGTLSAIAVSVGDRVSAGDILARLQNADMAAGVRQAEANIKIEEARLRELKAGARPEQIAVSEAKVSAASAAVQDAEVNLSDRFADAFTKAEDAVRNKVDQVFTNPTSNTPQLSSLSAPDFALRADTEWRRFVIGTETLPRLLTLRGAPVKDPVQGVREWKDLLNSVKSFIEQVSLIVNNPNTLRIVGGVGTAVPDTWKADVSLARTNVNAAIAAIIAAEEKLQSAKSSLAVAQDELALVRAGTVADQVAAQEARVESVRAAAEELRVQFAKTFLRSPISGTITRAEGDAGEIVAAHNVIVSVMSLSRLQAEAFVPEADIAKVRAGAIGTATLDAYGADVVFPVVVTSIDPAETIVDGVATYRVVFNFGEADPRIRSGMTANIEIVADRREGAIIVPSRAVVGKNGGKKVRILGDGGEVREAIVETGLRGTDGRTEIVSGVAEGDVIVVSAE